MEHRAKQVVERRNHHPPGRPPPGPSHRALPRPPRTPPRLGWSSVVDGTGSRTNERMPKRAPRKSRARQGELIPDPRLPPSRPRYKPHSRHLQNPCPLQDPEATKTAPGLPRGWPAGVAEGHPPRPEQDTALYWNTHTLPPGPLSRPSSDVLRRQIAPAPGELTAHPARNPLRRCAGLRPGIPPRLRQGHRRIVPASGTALIKRGWGPREEIDLAIEEGKAHRAPTRRPALLRRSHQKGRYLAVRLDRTCVCCHGPISTIDVATVRLHPRPPRARA